MPKFTEGQKVRVLPYGGRASLLPGTVLTVLDPDSTDDDIFAKDQFGGRFYINENHVEAVDTHTEQEKTVTALIPGKRYRVTVTGTARSVDQLPLDGSNEDGRAGACLYHNVLELAKIELLPDPLPTSPGSVIRDNVGDLFMAGPTGRWFTTGSSVPYSTDEMAHPLTVLFDAGAEVKA